jgi:hypothetical protein
MYKDLLTKYLSWYGSMVGAESTPATRFWCDMDLPKLDQATIKATFDLTGLEAEYLNVMGSPVVGPKIGGYIKDEMDLVQSMHRCFNERHTSRLSRYAASLSQRSVHQRATLVTSFAQHQINRDRAETLT